MYIYMYICMINYVDSLCSIHVSLFSICTLAYLCLHASVPANMYRGNNTNANTSHR